MATTILAPIQHPKSLADQLSESLAKYSAAQAEIFILSRKVDALSTISTEQVTEFKEKEIQSQYEFNQKEEQYINTINSLEEQIKNLSMRNKDILIEKEQLEVKVQNDICSIHQYEKDLRGHRQTITNLTKLNKHLALQVIYLPSIPYINPSENMSIRLVHTHHKYVQI